MGNNTVLQITNIHLKQLTLLTGSLDPPSGEPLGHPNIQLSSTEYHQNIESLMKHMGIIPIGTTNLKLYLKCDQHPP